MRCLCDEYKEGYTDGVSDIRNKLLMQVHKLLIEQKNIQQDDTYCTGDDIDEGRHEGWIECLEMIKHTLESK